MILKLVHEFVLYSRVLLLINTFKFLSIDNNFKDFFSRETAVTHVRSTIVIAEGGRCFSVCRSSAQCSSASSDEQDILLVRRARRSRQAR